MTKDLTAQAINIQGKKYVLVNDRVAYFNETYPNGVIQTQLVDALDQNTIVIKAKVIPDIDKPERFFTGYSQAVIGQGMVNKTAALENCETSAVGRALGFMGIGIVESIASVDEMYKATQQSNVVTTKPNGEVSNLGYNCPIHGERLTERLSKKTGKTYFAHELAEGGLCFGENTKGGFKKVTREQRN